MVSCRRLAWLQKAPNKIHDGPWMTQAKQTNPDDVTLAREEIHASCDRVLGLWTDI